jgi:UDP-N-acetylglucosamine 4,6-dehydratase/5-epimerase
MYESILITGGTGSFGKRFVSRILDQYKHIKRLVVFSRDELKQFDMQQMYPADKYPQLRFFLGDVRDKNRLKMALQGIDAVIHAAALKQVPAAEYNPFEFVNTNILGAQNIIEASFEKGVKQIVALSTDKACSPINLYGATKLCSDKLFVSSNNIAGSRDYKASIVRYGNVMGSRGSVIPFFWSLKDMSSLPITDSEMTRFNITLDEGVNMVFWALENSLGGEIFVPKIPSYRITDVAEAMNPGGVKDIVGIRPGEKIHEEMIHSSDAPNTIDLGRYYAILPIVDNDRFNGYFDDKSVTKVSTDFSYNSGDNHDFMSINEIRDLIKKELKYDL